MFDFGMGELLIIGFVVLIVVGLKDFLVLFCCVGNFVGKVCVMGCEFSLVMNQVVDNSGMGDIINMLKVVVNFVKGVVDVLVEYVKVVVNFDFESEIGKLVVKCVEDVKKIYDVMVKC